MKKSIILLLLSLFLFSINLNNKQTTSKKQSDTSITAASSFDCPSVLNIQDVEMNLTNSYVYHSDITTYELSSSSVKTSNHFVNYLNDQDYYINSPRLTVTNNSDKVRTIHLAKTMGLQSNNSQYFNIYLYHSTGKLGRT